MNYSHDCTGAAFHPGFRPQLRPKRMLKMGIFGGTYFITSPTLLIRRASASAVTPVEARRLCILGMRWRRNVL
jgi:hypothetical protein